MVIKFLYRRRLQPVYGASQLLPVLLRCCSWFMPKSTVLKYTMALGWVMLAIERSSRRRIEFFCSASGQFVTLG